jgi:hypothetical protein
MDISGQIVFTTIDRTLYLSLYLNVSTALSVRGRRYEARMVLRIEACQAGKAACTLSPFGSRHADAGPRICGTPHLRDFFLERSESFKHFHSI